MWPEVAANTHYLLRPPRPSNPDIAWFIYVPMTKCASTYMNNLFNAPVFDSQLWRCAKPEVRTPDRSRTRWLAILRDPVSRWISGATHWLSHCEQWQDRIDTVIKQIEMDVHTCPQFRFLDAVTQDHVLAIHYQSDLQHHVWFTQQGWRLQYPSKDRYNETQRHDIRKAVCARLTPPLLKIIQDYYHQDYELIRTTQFV